MKQLKTLLLLASFNTYLFAQNHPTIKNLVFEGAGIRGIAFCGAIQEMEKRNMMKDVERTAGSSAGSIVALAVALGYSGKEIENIISRTNFRQFNDGRYLFFGGINRLNKNFGWYKGNQFEKWLEKIIAQKTGNSDITFEELHRRGFRDIYIAGTSINRQAPVIFSHQTYPDMKIKDAVRISISIPLYFEAVFIDKNGIVIRRPKNKEGLDVMVDGGIVANFPIQIFDSSSAKNPFTLGFRIDSDEQIKNDSMDKKLAPVPAGNLKQYMNAFLNIIIENLNRWQLTEEDWKRTVSISDGNYEPRIRKLSKTEIRALIDNGRTAVKKYLN